MARAKLTGPSGFVIMTDINEAMLRTGRDRMMDEGIIGNIEFVQADAENLPFEKETFDIVTAAFLIVHLKDPTRFFDEAYRVLKDGGILAVTNTNQKDPPQVKTTPTRTPTVPSGIGRGSDQSVGEYGKIIIKSFYHRPEKIIEVLKSLAFNIEQEVFVKEKELWVNQILVAKK